MNCSIMANHRCELHKNVFEWFENSKTSLKKKRKCDDASSAKKSTNIKIPICLKNLYAFNEKTISLGGKRSVLSLYEKLYSYIYNGGENLDCMLVNRSTEILAHVYGNCWKTYVSSEIQSRIAQSDNFEETCNRNVWSDDRSNVRDCKWFYCMNKRYMEYAIKLMDFPVRNEYVGWVLILQAISFSISCKINTKFWPVRRSVLDVLMVPTVIGTNPLRFVTKLDQVYHYPEVELAEEEGYVASLPALNDDIVYSMHFLRGASDLGNLLEWSRSMRKFFLLVYLCCCYGEIEKSLSREKRVTNTKHFCQLPPKTAGVFYTLFRSSRLAHRLLCSEPLENHLNAIQWLDTMIELTRNFIQRNNLFLNSLTIIYLKLIDTLENIVALERRSSSVEVEEEKLKAEENQEK